MHRGAEARTCEAVLRCAALCCAVLCCAVLCCAVLCCALPVRDLGTPQQVTATAAQDLRLLPWKMLRVFRDFAEWVNNVAFNRSTRVPLVPRPDLRDRATTQSIDGPRSRLLVRRVLGCHCHCHSPVWCTYCKAVECRGSRALHCFLF